MNHTPTQESALTVISASLDVLNSGINNAKSVTLAYESMALATKVLITSMNTTTPTALTTTDVPDGKPHDTRNAFPAGYDRSATMKYNRMNPFERQSATINASTLAWFTDQPGDHFASSCGVRTIDVFYAIVMHCTNTDGYGAQAQNIEAITGMLRQNTPSHLTNLRDQGLVIARKRKQKVYWQPTKYALTLMDEVSLQEAER